VTRPSRREYAAVQRERYLAATRAEKGALLNEVVAVTGLHRKAAIRLLRRPPRTPTARSRAGRPSLYGSAVAQALAVLWQATGGIGPQRLHPYCAGAGIGSVGAECRAPPDRRCARHSRHGGGPNGIWHLVGQYLRFSWKGSAFRA
jgi:hypothetical protein